MKNKIMKDETKDITTDKKFSFVFETKNETKQKIKDR